MGWKMDSHGNWTKSGGSGTKKSGSSSGGNKGKSSGSSGGSSGKSSTDKGNTSTTSKSIKISTSNKENELKYAEEANFEIDGDYLVRRGGKMKIRNGVANRWKGTWYILETTHTVDSRGYKTEGLLGRVPYKEKTTSKKKKTTKKKTSTKKNSKASGSSSQKKSAGSKSGSGNKMKSSTVKKKWVMDSHGNWKQK